MERIHIMTNIYFDNSATTKIFPEAIQSMVETMENYYGNPSSLHSLGTEANQLLQAARQQIADAFECEADEIYFTSGGTESNNWVLRGTATAKREFGRHIITTQVEHPSVQNTMNALEELGFEVTYLPVDKEGKISVKDLQAAIRPDTILVSVMAINNEVGAIQPIEAIGDLLNDYPKIHFHVDGVQSLGKFNPVLIHPRVDFLSLSAHKFNGPRGVGILYKKANRVLDPLLTGGGQEKQQRSSTENLAGIVATAKAIRLTLDRSVEENARHQKMMTMLRDFLSQQPACQIFSPVDAAPHILCFATKGVRGEVMVHALEEDGIYISTTSACSSRATGKNSTTLEAMHIDGKWAQNAVRVSLGTDNTISEMEEFLDILAKHLEHFERIQ